MIDIIVLPDFRNKIIIQGKSSRAIKSSFRLLGFEKITALLNYVV